MSGHADQFQASISVNAVVNISIKKHRANSCVIASEFLGFIS